MSQHARDLIRRGLDEPTHDEVIAWYAECYKTLGKVVYTNPGPAKNKAWNGCYIDIVALDYPKANAAILVEVETDTSISDTEAKEQWVPYSKNNDGWYLAVPANRAADAHQLLRRHNISNCHVVTWQRHGPSDKFILSELPQIALSPCRKTT